jgi:hypothetical protein
MITNATVFPYELNTHASHMLINGMFQYVEMIVDEYKYHNEFPSYCMLMLGTARQEVKRLLAWLRKVKRSPIGIYDLKRLIRKIDYLQKKFKVLEDEELRQLRKSKE